MTGFLLGSLDYTVMRRAEGEYVDGDWVEEDGEGEPIEEEEETVSGSFQPLRPWQINMVPEGFRNREAKMFYTTDTLKVLSPTQRPDILVDGDVRFMVVGESDWSAFLLPHREYVLVRETS